MMNEEELITIVQEYPFLYNFEDRRYSNVLCTENAWEEIAKRMNIKSDDCKTKWKNLRDGYRRHLKLKVTKSGQAATKIKRWKFEKQMQFLEKNLLYQREQIRNVENDENIDSNTPIIVNSDIEDESQRTAEETGDIETQEICETPVHQRQRKKHASQVSPSTQVLKEYIDFKKEQRGHVVKDHLTKYFQGVEETVRTFPPLLQIKVKTEISNVVHKAEIEAILDKPSS